MSGPSNPYQTASLATTTNDFTWGTSWRIRIWDDWGGYLYLVVQDRFASFDVSDPYDPDELDSVLLDEDIGAIPVIITSDGYAYVGGGTDQGGDNRIWTFDVTDPEDLTQVDVFEEVGQTQTHDLDLGPNEEWLYSASYGNDRFVSIDISDRENPAYVDGIDVVGTHDVAVDSDGQYAYTPTYGELELVSVDISDPTNLTRADTLEFGEMGRALDVELTDDEQHIFVGDGAAADGGGYLVSIDVSEPTNLTEVSRAWSDLGGSYRFRYEKSAGKARVYGNERRPDPDLFGVDGDPNGITVWDVSNPQDIKTLGFDWYGGETDDTIMDVHLHPDPSVDVLYASVLGREEENAEPHIAVFDIGRRQIEAGTLHGGPSKA